MERVHQAPPGNIKIDQPDKPSPLHRSDVSDQILVRMLDLTSYQISYQISDTDTVIKSNELVLKLKD